MDASKVRVGVTGAVYVAPNSTDLPTDATTALPSAHEDVGYISDDGVTETQDTSSEDITAWQGGAKVRKVQTEHDLMYSFTMLETSEVTLREYYGNYADGTIKITGTELPHRVWVLSVVDGDHVLRVVIPDGQVTEREDVEYVGSDATSRGVTITCYPVPDPDDPENPPVKAIIYLDDGDTEAT